MAGQISSPPSVVIGDTPTLPHKGSPLKVNSGEPILDDQGNVLPYPNYKAGLKDKYGQISPIPRLAAVADLKREVPTAGQYAIEHSKEPQLEIPPECYLYDEDRPWVLGKLNPEALDLPEPAEPVPLPQHVIDHLDALEAAALADIRKRAGLPDDSAEQSVKKAQAIDDKKNGNYIKNAATEQAAEGKIGASVTMSAKKPKSRNSSVSPGPVKVAVRPSSGRSPVATPPRSPAPTSRVGSAKSPARGVSPQPKNSSPRPSTKKIMNAK